MRLLVHLRLLKSPVNSLWFNGAGLRFKSKYSAVNKRFVQVTQTLRCFSTETGPSYPAIMVLYFRTTFRMPAILWRPFFKKNLYGTVSPHFVIKLDGYFEESFFRFFLTSLYCWAKPVLSPIIDLVKFEYGTKYETIIFLNKFIVF